MAEDRKIPEIQVSVRGLVAFSVPDDTAWTFVSYAAMREGGQAHVQVQQALGAAGTYRAEVTMSLRLEAAGQTVLLSGRADGILGECAAAVIHEIKSTSVPLDTLFPDYSPSHWAQLQCYALMHAEAEDREVVQARLTYCDRRTGATRDFDRVFTRDALRRHIRSLLLPYVRWAVARHNWRMTRDESIRALAFPWPEYRKGQKLLAYNVYRTLEDGRKLFAQAPTGTGKTMGVLYPVIKAMGEGRLERIFYLTAKTTTKNIAESACRLLQQNGLRLKVLTLTAKDRMCLMAVKNCDPEKCPYAEGLPARMPRVAKSLLKKHDFLHRDLISEAGQLSRVCPFELSLELSLGCDLIIADYNYVFDPRIALKRFFQQKTRQDFAFLVDEAHNLKDRAQGMYSAVIRKDALAELKKNAGKAIPDVLKRLQTILRELVRLEKTLMADCEETGGTRFHTSAVCPEALLEPVSEFLLEAEPHIHPEENAPAWQDELVQVFFDLLHFRNILELYGPEYRTLALGKGKGFQLQLVCMDPSPMLEKRMAQARTTILFSATLTPLPYYRTILGGAEADATLRLPSPFPRENLCVMIADALETRYRHREEHLPGVALALDAFIRKSGGNCMVFFPSYSYMEKVLEQMPEPGDEMERHVQDRAMTEPMRDEFLARFERHGDRIRVGFCVLGGIFGEGIDLTGDRLTGVAIIGVGLPQVSPEVEIARRYYEERWKAGFDYAFVYPGLNRVLQAAGRLIRTTSDRGTLLLVDARYADSSYARLLPPEWHPVPYVRSDEDMSRVIDEWRMGATAAEPAQVTGPAAGGKSTEVGRSDGRMQEI